MGHNLCDVPTNTRNVRLVFKHPELLYDIENCSFVEGDIMADDNDHAKHHVFDVGQEGNVNRVARVLDLAYSECVEMLYPYTKSKIAEGQDALDDMLCAPEEYTIDLTLPEDFSLTTLKLLKTLIHEYLVCKVLSDWMSITNPKSQANWEEKLARLKERIQVSLVSRTGKMRRRLKPF